MMAYVKEISSSQRRFIKVTEAKKFFRVNGLVLCSLLKHNNKLTYCINCAKSRITNPSVDENGPSKVQAERKIWKKRKTAIFKF